MREIIIGAALLLIISIISVVHISGKPPANKTGYTGVKVCAECHGEDAIGNQYKIWSGSPHARAFRTLKGEEALKIAEGAGIKDPATSRRCLRCHTTGGGEWSAVSEEGVGCEACHGPGEKYHTASGHVDYASRENGYRRAVKLGMYPILGITALRARERMCLSCHTDKRPCYSVDHKNPYKYRIPIQTIDTLMKGDVNFRHPLRR